MYTELPLQDGETVSRHLTTVEGADDILASRLGGRLLNLGGATLVASFLSSVCIQQGTCSDT